MGVVGLLVVADGVFTFQRAAGAGRGEKKLSPHLYGASALGMGWEMRIYWAFRGLGAGNKI